MTAKQRARIYRKAARISSGQKTIGIDRTFEFLRTKSKSIYEFKINFDVLPELIFFDYSPDTADRTERSNLRIIALLLSSEIALNP